MKKTLFVLLALTTVSTAAADSLGLHAKYGRTFAANSSGNFTFGLDYTYDLDAQSAVRGGIDIDPDLIGSGLFGLQGDVAYLRDFDGVGDAMYNIYYGGSLGLGFATGSSSNVRVNLFEVNPTALVGARYFLTPEFALNAEVNVGPDFLLLTGSNGTDSASDTNTSFGAGVRLGINYRF
ncbi:hypothetical protein ACFFLM_01565 [Deinococcus oregonensis]|uniref:Outer membrane protein beta-barrel domain-containing protein n=1 Tax=Deinococcus oregonensis TaxID=1805970 RepID=A0ABV6AT47_9DEIO